VFKQGLCSRDGAAPGLIAQQTANTLNVQRLDILLGHGVSNVDQATQRLGLRRARGTARASSLRDCSALSLTVILLSAIQ